MTQNNKGQVPIQNLTPKTTDSKNHNGTDPLIGWFNFVTGKEGGGNVE